MTPPSPRVRPTPPPRDQPGVREVSAATQPSDPGPATPTARKPFRAKAIAAVTLAAVLLRMVRNLFVYGRPFPPPFVFKEPPE